MVRRLALAGSVVLAACSPKEPASTDSTTSTSGTTSTSDKSSATASTSTAATTSSGSDGESDSSGSSATTTTTGATTEATTASTAATTGAPVCACGPDEFCDWNTNNCGARWEEGVCTARPPACDLVFAPVCGCDGQAHGNECEAASKGVDVAAEGGCETPEGMFPCGFRFCQQGLEFCVVEISDVNNSPHGFGCVALPPGCDPPACDCLEGVPCAELCEQLPSGDLVITCPGG